ncbi:MAG: 16S rRNA (guanine(527)-N(7))-methyltransferase RsmG [Caenibius sp.]
MIDSEAGARAFVASLCDDVAMDRLCRFIDLLIEENERQNLVAAKSLGEVWQRHIADSAQLLSHVSRETLERPWLDLGTGAGFPGVVIAILRPQWPVRLVESRARRIEWLRSVVLDLKLAHCEVIGSRLEQVETFSASVISARAFAPMPRLLDLSARFSTAETLWLLPKGRSAAQDLASLPKAMRDMFHVEQSLTDAASGIVLGSLAGKTERTR